MPCRPRNVCSLERRVASGAPDNTEELEIPKHVHSPASLSLALPLPKANHVGLVSSGHLLTSGRAALLEPVHNATTLVQGVRLPPNRWGTAQRGQVSCLNGERDSWRRDVAVPALLPPRQPSHRATDGSPLESKQETFAFEAEAWQTVRT